MKKAVGEKELQISLLEAKHADIEKRLSETKSEEVKNTKECIESMAKKLEENSKILTMKIEKLEAKVKTEDKKSFKCVQCEFEASSERGLQSHVGRKHKAENKKYPSTCDLCDFEFKNEKEMKKHMYSHSYNNIQFKCDECDFFGSDELSMELHFRKTHNETVECALCDSTFKDTATLDIHIFTCEVYRCNKCQLNLKTLSDLKKHIVEEHEGQSTKIYHAKQDRKNKEEVS